MGKKKFFAAAFAAFVLWAIVILQTVLTRWYVSQTAFEQAFAKSDIMKASTQEAAADTRNINSDNRVMEGVVNGRRINMMAAFSYDENKDVTKVVFGTPLINSDF